MGDDGMPHCFPVKDVQGSPSDNRLDYPPPTIEVRPIVNR